MKATQHFSGSPGTLEEPNRLVGYCAIYNSESAILIDPGVCDGPFIEVIAPGAFTRTLRENPDILALFSHNTQKVLGRTGSGTLKLTEDNIGLTFDVSLPNTTWASDLRESIKRNDFSGGSFHGHVIKHKVEKRPGLPALRTLIEVSLVEITPATARPAYDSTSVVLRELLDPPAKPEVTPTPVLNLARRRLVLANS